jgi:hypothetical protein
MCSRSLVVRRARYREEENAPGRAFRCAGAGIAPPVSDQFGQPAQEGGILSDSKCRFRGAICLFSRCNVDYSLTIMRFHPTVTFEQYRDTCQAIAAAKPKGVRQRSWKGYVGLGIVCLAVGLSPQIPAARIPALTVFVAFALLWLICKPLARRSQDRCFRTMFSEEQELLNNQILSIDESGIACDRGNGQATSHYTWNAFIKRIDMPDAYVFLLSPNSFIRVPKEMLATSDLELVCQWSATVPLAQQP